MIFENIIFISLFTLVISFILSFFLIKGYLINFQKFSANKNIEQAHERWGDSNKSHLGGIAFTIPIILLFFFLIFYEKIKIDGFIYSIIFIVIFSTIVGIIDEKKRLSIKSKVLSQLIICFLLIWFEHIINITPYHWLNILFTTLWLFAFINALNLFDNVDSALASYAITIFSFFLILLILKPQGLIPVLIILTYIGSITGFLFFNIYPSKIFMGEVGSFQLASVLAVLSIYILWNDFNFWAYQYSPAFNSVYYLLLNNCIYLVIIVDTLLIFVVRALNKVNPLKGDTNHLSHMIFKLGFNPNQFALLVLILNIFLCILYFCLNFSIIEKEIIYGFIILILSYLMIFVSLTSLYLMGRKR